MSEPSQNKGRLSGKVALITGAGTGIGEATAHKFAREGAALFLMGLRGDPTDEVAAAITAQYGVEVESFAGDAAEEADARAAVERAVARFGRLDVLCNIAGVFLEVAETQDYSVETFDATLRNNCRSAFLMTKFALPHLQRSHGNIVNAGSVAGIMGEPTVAAYGGSKGFMHAFTRGVAYEQGRYGVRANCVCPGAIDTAWTRADTGPIPAEHMDIVVAGSVIGRRGTPEEIANIFAFLASDEATYVTGALWLADGGTSVAKGGPGKQSDEFFKTAPAGVLELRHSHSGEKNKKVVR